MIKLQTHVHTKGGSRCALATPQEACADIFGAGFGGVVITNHYAPRYFEDYPGDNQKQKLDFYFSLIEDAKKVLIPNGLKVFYGTEVRVYLPDDLFAEYMIYGYEDKFLYDNKPLFTYTQQELFRLCDKANVFMYQVHPFRDGVTTGDVRYIHGAESFNGHVGHNNNNGLALKMCNDNNLIKMSGTDYHCKGQPVLGGIYIPDNVNDNRALADCIFNRQHKVIDQEQKYLELRKRG